MTKETTEQLNQTRTGNVEGQNAMLIERVRGCVKEAIGLLGQLKPQTESVEGCIITLKSWQTNNLKHLQKAFE